ncbi:MAG: hypothetical protein C0507_12840 [Cyanobacteria bacterium PR.3.49]|nr:hypothetical protein [Cyanobacteria bacterium PR.3.49]
MMNSYNIERVCTSSAEKALMFARQEAKDSGRIVDAKFLMLGLLKEGKGIGAKHLAYMNISAETLMKLDANGLADGVERYLERAFEECHRLGHEFIGSEHLLLSLLAEDANGEIFEKLNVDPDSARHKLLQFLGA